jgi:hypothetical protein
MYYEKTILFISMSVLLNAQHNDHHSSDLSLGLDYEYRLNNWLGIGLLGEAVFTESMELIAVFAEEHVDSHVEPIEAYKEAHFGVRLGAGYDFHLGKLSVGPAIYYDIANTSALLESDFLHRLFQFNSYSILLSYIYLSKFSFLFD